MKIETEMDARGVVLRVRGTIDPEYVRALRTSIDELTNRPGRVIIDLGEARDVQHLALAMLAEDAANRRSPSVVLAGLCEHHLRMMRYFGHPPAAREPMPRSTPALADA